MTEPRHLAFVVAVGDAYELSCACGLWLVADWIEVVSELSAHMGAKLPGYAITDNET